MSLLEGDAVTKGLLSTAADLLKHARPEQTRFFVDAIGREVTITCREIDRDWMQALATAGASGSHARPAPEQFESLRSAAGR